MVHLTDFGKNGPVNPRTGYPARPPSFSYNGKWNDHFYGEFRIAGGSEYCVESDLYYFKPRVLGADNIRRIEQKYIDCNKKLQNEIDLFSQSIGFDRWTSPDPINWTTRNLLDKNKIVALNDEQIQIAKMMSSYRNRSSFLYLCLKFALETDFVSKYGFDIDKKNRENDRSSEEKRIVYTINGRKYAFLISLEWSHIGGWSIDFRQINFQMIEETV